MTIHSSHLKLKNLSKDSIDFNLLLLGPSGIGKKTFLSNLTNKTSLFNNNIFNQALASNLIRNNNEHTFQYYNLQIENMINDHDCNLLINLNAFVLDTSNRMDNSKTGQIIKQFIESKFDDILDNEIKIQRKTTYNDINDNRIHLCIYFFDSKNYGISEIDLNILSYIIKSVNILYVIGKADKILNNSDHNKEQLLLHLQQKINFQLHSFNLYSFTFDKITINDIFFSTKEQNKEVNESMKCEEYPPNILIDNIQPFPIICGNIKEMIPTSTNKFFWKRSYLFKNKEVYIEDFETSSFIILKGIILGSHLQIFKDITNNRIYESYRSQILLQRAETQLRLDKNHLNQDFDTIISTNTINSNSNYTPNLYSLKEKNKIIKAYEETFNNVNKIIKDNISFNE